MSVVFPTSELNPLTAITAGRFIDVCFPALIVTATHLAAALGMVVYGRDVWVLQNSFLLQRMTRTILLNPHQSNPHI
jgi:hypothetical protein